MRREISCFIVAGCAAVATDLCVYHLLFTALSYELSKGISYVSGTLVAYILNKLWTFRQPKHSWREVFAFVVLYAITFTLNVGVNQFTLLYLPWFGAFLCATGVSTIANFLGQKLWVFKRVQELLKEDCAR